MVHYKKNVTIVINTLKRYRYGPRSISMSEKCYGAFKSSIEDAGITLFSEERALGWCETQVAKTYRFQYRTALLRLADVYAHGRVLGSHLMIYAQPSDDYIEMINDYISSVSSADCYTRVHLKNIRHACTQFCCFAQYNGIHSVKEIDYSILEQYDSFLRESGRAYYITEGLIVGFLKYLADKGICRIGYSLFVHYVESDKCTSLRDMSEKAGLIIESRRRESSIFPPDEFYRTIPHFKERLVSSGYSKTVTDSAPYHLTLLFLFLDRAGLGYDRTIAGQWFGCAGERIFGRGALMARRTYEMYDDYTNEGDVLPGHRWKHRETAFDLLPSWYKAEPGHLLMER